jgi:hypothetical protein
VQTAHFLASVSDPVHIVAVLLDTYYPERTTAIMSANPPYCSPAVKCMLRRKDQLMRSGRMEEAGALLALKIGEAVTNFNSAELSKVDILSGSRDVCGRKFVS